MHMKIDGIMMSVHWCHTVCALSLSLYTAFLVLQSETCEKGLFFWQIDVRFLDISSRNMGAVWHFSYIVNSNDIVKVSIILFLLFLELCSMIKIGLFIEWNSIVFNEHFINLKKRLLIDFFIHISHHFMYS